MSNDLLSWSENLENLLKGIDLSSYESKSLMEAWLNEELTPVQTGAFWQH